MSQVEVLTVNAEVINPASSAINDFVNTVTVSDDGFNGPDPDLTNNSDSDLDVLDAVPNLAVVKTNDLIAAAVPGQTFNYFVEVTNNGNQAATGVTMTDNLPIGVIVPGSVVTNDPGNVVYDSGTGQLNWAVGYLSGGGDSRTLRVTVTMQDPVATLAATFDNIATTTDDLTNGPDPDLSDNTSSVTTVLDATPDYVITKADSLTQAAMPGDTFDYTLVVTNVGNQNGTGVVVTDDLPIDIIDPNSVQTDDAANVAYDSASGVLLWNIGNLNGRGDTRSLTVTVTIQQPLADPTLRSIPNTASVVDDGLNGPDFVPDNNTTTINSDLLVYAFDSINDFSGQGKNIDYDVVGETSDHVLPAIPIDTIYSGISEPGTTLRFTIYDETGHHIGQRTVVADLAGNWVAGFPGTIINKQPHRMEVDQTPAAYNVLEDAGFNLRRYFHPAVHHSLFFSEQPSIQSVMRNQPHTVLNTMHEANNTPIGFSWNAHSQELLSSSTNASVR
jgi:uncharacterized repeat protein (TIGR01451 family)